MAQIGAFTMKDGTWTGTIRTMTINVKARSTTSPVSSILYSRTHVSLSPAFSLFANASRKKKLSEPVGYFTGAVKSCGSLIAASLGHSVFCRSIITE